MFSLAHLSDPHLPLLPGAAPLLGLTGKQVLSRLAWQRRRRRITDEAVLDALALDLGAAAPDHIVVTGDLVNLGTLREMSAASGWLARLGPVAKISVVPGNHDCLAGSEGLAKWAAWMGEDRTSEAVFPFLRRRGQMAMIGLCSGVPTPMFLASGFLGAAQLERAAHMLAEAGSAGLFRVVLIHHPPLMGDGGRRKALRDRAALCAVLQAHGAELVLHGHHHGARVASLAGPDGPIPVIGVPSASAGVARPELGGWHLHRIERAGDFWRVQSVARGYDPHAGRFEQVGAWATEIGISRSA